MQIERANVSILVPDGSYKAEAAVVANWTQKAGTMLKLTEGEVLRLFEEQRSILMVDAYAGLIAHAAITLLWPENWSELGGLYVSASYRGEGVGHNMVNALISYSRQRYPDGRKFALCNVYSLKLFTDNGGQIIKHAELPKEVFEACGSCPTRPSEFERQRGTICCDTPVELTKAGL